MIREFGKAQIYVGDELIGEVESVEASIVERGEVEVTDFSEPVSMQYEGEIKGEFEMPPEYLKQMQALFEMPERDKRIKSRLGRVFKQVKIPPHVYSKISDSLNKLERGRK